MKENTKASGDIPPQYIGNLTIKITNETIKLSVERAENESYDVKYEIIKRDYNRSAL